MIIHQVALNHLQTGMLVKYSNAIYNAEIK